MGNQSIWNWQWTDWFVIGFRLFGFIISFSNFFGTPFEQILHIIIPWALISFALPQLFYLPNFMKPKTYIAAETILSGGLALYLILFSVEAIGYLYIPFLVVSYVVTRFRHYWITPLIMLLILAVIMWLELFDAEQIINIMVNLSVFMAMGAAFAVFIKQQIQLNRTYAALKQKNRELENYVQQMERLTLLEERSRVSKELHDTVGHSVTASVLGMEAIYTLIDRDPEQAKTRTRQLITINRESLADFRASVHAMAASELNDKLDDLLESTIEKFREQTGVSVYSDLSPVNIFLSDTIKIILLRCLQESLTNAVRHGEASELHVFFGYLKGNLVLEIQDNGIGISKASLGFGLTSMKNRVEGQKGTLEIISNQNGTTIKCSIPMEG